MTNQQRNQHKMLAKEIRIASEAHEKAMDKGGKAYILHPLRIMMRLRTEDPELMQIAVMHDVVEDSEITIADLTDMGFSDRVTSALVLLTHTNPDVSYEDYIGGIATNHDAVLVKMEDLRDNSDITRLKGVRQKDLDRVAKYHRAYLTLDLALANFSDVA